jgi:cytochrome c oxidase subunit 4
MAAADHHPTPKDYMYVFLALLALLVMTCGLSFVDFDRLLPGHFWSTAIALLIAIAKALLIMLYFMHVKTGPKRAWVFAGAGFLWLGILVVLSFSDYVTRNQPPGNSPKGEPHYLLPEKT